MCCTVSCVFIYLVSYVTKLLLLYTNYHALLRVEFPTLFGWKCCVPVRVNWHTVCQSSLIYYSNV